MSSRGSAVKKKLRARLYKRARGKCALCGRIIPKTEATIDHVIPLSKGGTWDRWNLQLACRSCNGEKGDKYGEDVEV